MCSFGSLPELRYAKYVLSRCDVGRVCEVRRRARQEDGFGRVWVLELTFSGLLTNLQVTWLSPSDT